MPVTSPPLTNSSVPRAFSHDAGIFDILHTFQIRGVHFGPGRVRATLE